MNLFSLIFTDSTTLFDLKSQLKSEWHLTQHKCDYIIVLTVLCPYSHSFPRLEGGHINSACKGSHSLSLKYA